MTVKQYIESKCNMLGISQEKKDRILKIWQREAIHAESLYHLEAVYQNHISIMYDIRFDKIIKMEKSDSN